MSFNNLLRNECDIFKITTSQDPLTGDVSESYSDTPSTSGAKCLIQPLSGSQALEAQGLEIVSEYKGFFLHGEDINLRDKILFQNKVLYVSYVFENWKGTAHHQEVMLRMERTENEI